MLELFISAFLTFFVVIDPPGCAPIFASLTRTAAAANRRAQAIRAVVVAACILVFFAVAGEGLLGALGVELSAFRIAGGIMLFAIALDMVFEKRTQRREERAEKVIAQNQTTPEEEDVSIFPMAMPMIAGPGSIATVMLLTSKADSWNEVGVVMGALAAVLLLTMVALIAATPLLRLLGEKIEAIITRLLGVLLAAFAVQFIINGLKEAFPALV